MTLEELITSHREKREMCIQLLVHGTKDTTQNMKMETPKISDSEKWNFKMEWCHKAGFSPCNDLYWELAERAYAQRYFVNSPDQDISLKKFQDNSH